ncbi:MAG: HAMP domain-containing sensor histidine kinase [bacterium]
MTVLAAVVLIVVGLALFLDQHSYQGSLDGNLLDVATTAEERIGQRGDLSAVLDEFSTASTFLQTQDLEGHLTAKSSNLGADEIPYRRRGTPLTRNGYHTVEFHKQELRLVRHALQQDGAVVGYIIVARAVPDSDRRLVDLGGILLGTASFGLLVGLVGTVILVRREVAPLRKLTDEALAATSSGFNVPLISEGDRSEEARELRQALSALVASQQHLLARERSFFADSSHVLRTPLAVLQGALEQLDAGVTGPEREHSLSQAHAALQTMSQSVSSLLLLSRDGPSDPATWEAVEIDPILQRLVEGVKAANPGLRISSEVAPGLVVAGDRYQLNSLFASILENATHYTPEGGSIALTAEAEDGDLVVRISDSGVGFTDEEREHAFERFYRGRAARAMRAEGSGLGLSIARRIAELHNGRLFIEPRPGGGSTIRITVPLIG